MNHKRNTRGIIASAKARSDEALRRSSKALREIIRSGQPVTFKAVANRAGVSTRYLSQHPELGPQIRQLSTHHTSTSTSQAAQQRGQQPGVIIALKKEMRSLNAQHAQEVRALRKQIRDLENQVASLTGKLVEQQHGGTPT